MGIAVLLKFSALVFVPAALLTMVVLKAAIEPRRPPRHPMHAVTPPDYSFSTMGVLLVAFLVFWAGYRFHLGTLNDIQLGGLRVGAHVSPEVAPLRIVPAPEFWTGLLIVLWYNRLSLPAYVLGQVVPGGTWYFFPVALGVKTPLAFLILMAIGAGVTVAVAKRHRLWACAIPLGTAARAAGHGHDQPDRARPPAPAGDLSHAGHPGRRGRRLALVSPDQPAVRPAGGGPRGVGHPGGVADRLVARDRTRTTCRTSTSWRRRGRSTSCSTATWTTARTSAAWPTRCGRGGSTRLPSTCSPSATTGC